MQTNFDNFDWEKIGAETFRAKAIGGWVLLRRVTRGIYTDFQVLSESMIFIKDENHEWNIAKEK